MSTESIASVLNAPFPEGWRLSHVILLDPEWQIIAKDDANVAIGTGDSIEEAIAACVSRILDEKFAGRLFEIGRLASAATSPPQGLADLLAAVAPPKIIINRRGM